MFPFSTSCESTSEQDTRHAQKNVDVHNAPKTKPKNASQGEKTYFILAFFKS